MHLHIDLFIPNDFSDIFIRRSKYPVKFKDSETLKLDREGERERERENFYLQRKNCIKKRNFENKDQNALR